MALATSHVVDSARAGPALQDKLDQSRKILDVKKVTARFQIAHCDVPGRPGLAEELGDEEFLTLVPPVKVEYAQGYHLRLTRLEVAEQQVLRKFLAFVVRRRQ